MPPKKAQKMSLNEFLGDSNYGSWADEMDNFPTAPAPKADDGFRGSALSRAPDRSDPSRYPPREEVPLPTQPPYTAFVGNLPFDLTESELEQHFGPHKTRSVKIIKDRDDKPKGFGYVEFETLDGLKSALDKSGSSLAGRMIRTSVAEPPKERERSDRGGFGDRGFDDDRQWRREGPLPPLDRPDRGGFGGERRGSRFDESNEPRGGFGSKFQSREDRPPPPQSIAEEVTDWRSMAKPPAPPPSRGPPPHSGERRGSNFGQNEKAERDAALTNHPSETEEKWSIGSKFKPAAPERENSGSSFGRKFHNGRPGFGERGQSGGDSAHGSPTPITASLSEDNADWRTGPRKVAPPSGPISRQGSQESSGPGGPPMRRKLELLPRSSAPSAVSSPLASPKDGSAAKPSALKANPFGDAKPVNAAAREREIAEKIERQRSVPGQGNTSWGNSRTGSRHTSRAPSEADDMAPPSKQILSREPEGNTSTSASTSAPPPKEKEKEKFGTRAPPPPPLSKSGQPAGERRTSTSGPSAGGLKTAFSFAKAAGGGGGGGSGSGADAPGAWTRKGSVTQ